MQWYGWVSYKFKNPEFVTRCLVYCCAIGDLLLYNRSVFFLLYIFNMWSYFFFFGEVIDCLFLNFFLQTNIEMCNFFDTFLIWNCETPLLSFLLTKVFFRSSCFGLAQNNCLFYNGIFQFISFMLCYSLYSTLHYVLYKVKLHTLSIMMFFLMTTECIVWSVKRSSVTIIVFAYCSFVLRKNDYECV